MQDPGDDRNESRLPDISFVMPVRDDAARLKKCLESIRANDYPPERVEIVVVDNGSHDDSAAVAKRAGARVIDAPHEGVSEMRNIGAAAARAQILVFVDADHVLGAGWIRAAIEDLGDQTLVAAVGALCRAPDDGTWVQRAYDRLRGHQVGRQRVDWLGAGNMAVGRRAFERVGGFDRSLETCEDVDLCKRLRAEGFTLIGDDRLVNIHLGDPATLGALFRGELWRGRGNVAVSFRPPVTFRELPSVMAPIIQLFGLALAALAFLMAGTNGLVIVSLGLLPSAVVPALRAARMSGRIAPSSAREIAGNAAVAFVYDLARAVAIVAFAGHGVRRRGRHAAAADA